MFDRKPAHMHLENDRLFPRGARVLVVVPGEGAFDHSAFRHVAGAVATVEGEVLARAADPVAEQHVAPAELAGQRPRIGVEQELVRIEAVAGSRLVRAVYTVPV